MVKKAAHPYHQVVYLLQGGGALGAYQVGVCEGLLESGCEPNWIIGTSIGGINGAIIAGNKPEDRVAKLKEFWKTVCIPLPDLFPNIGDHCLREMQNIFSSEWVLNFGVNGFFTPRFPPPIFTQDTPDKLSFYDTGLLRNTLEKLIDFDIINSKKIRLTLGAVSLRDGRLKTFDNTKQTITVDHVMASGALPPGFPAVKIDGEYYWDGGLCSNTPLQTVLAENTSENILCFMVHLFAHHEGNPKSMFDVSKRKKDIEYTSRYKSAIDMLVELQRQEHEIKRLQDKLGESCLMRHPPVLNVVRFHYRDKPYDLWSKDFEFSECSINERFNQGLADVQKAFIKPDWLDLISDGVHLHNF